MPVDATLMHETTTTTTIKITTLKIIKNAYKQLQIPSHRFVFSEMRKENFRGL